MGNQKCTLAPNLSQPATEFSKTDRLAPQVLFVFPVAFIYCLPIISSLCISSSGGNFYKWGRKSEKKNKIEGKRRSVAAWSFSEDGNKFVQFKTTVIGEGGSCSGALFTRNFCPSAVT